MKTNSVLITGANRGIGLEFVRQIAILDPPPRHLFAACRNPDSATELQKLASNHSNIKLKQLDVTDVKSIERLAESVTADLGDDGLNLLVNNAGRLRRLQLGDVTEEFMIDSFRVNTLGPLLMSQAFVPLLKKAATKSQTDGLSCDKAAIINISTLTSSLSDNRSGGFYDSRITKFTYMEQYENIHSGRASGKIFQLHQQLESRHMQLYKTKKNIQRESVFSMRDGYQDAWQPIVVMIVDFKLGANIELQILSSIYNGKMLSSLYEQFMEAALNMVTKNLSVDLKDSGILVVSMDPGWVKTDMGGERAKMGVEESIGKILNQFSSLSAVDTGTFMNYNGKQIPW